MQIIIDTAKDSAGTIYNAAMWLLSQVTKPAPAAGEIVKAPEAPTPPLPPPADVFKAPESQTAPINSAPLPPSLPVPPGPVAEVERDTAGVPFDARIHQATRGRKQDGQWKLKKGISPDLVTAVLASLPIVQPASALPLPVPGNDVPAPPLPPAINGTTTGAPAAPVALVTPPVPPPPGVAAGVPSAPAPGPLKFRDVFKKVTDAQAANKLTKADVDALAGEVGMGGDDLAKLVLPANAQLLSAFNALLDARLAA